MVNVDSLIKQFSKKVQYAIDRMQYCSDEAYFEGLESLVLGGNEMKAIVEFASISKSNRHEIGDAARKLMAKFYAESGIIHHALNKPHGYAGDFEILEYIYDQKPHNSTVTKMGQTIDKWALSLSLPRAVRSRKNVLYFLLFESVHAANETMRVLSIGSGSARELRELPSDILAKMEITLIDKDKNSLEFAKNNLLAKVPDLNITLIEDLFSRVKLNSKFDIIYSFGVFDYLNDRVIENCFKQYIPLLKDDGKFIYSIKNSAQYQDWFYDIFTSWRFINRSIEDGARLATRSGLSIKETCRIESDVAAVFVCVQ